jgi:GDP-L-fucose synthase
MSEISDASGAVPDPAFWDGKRTVVTGGAGFLGKPTVRLLADLGAEVSAVRSSDHDLRELDACRQAIAGAEVVIHLAAKVGGIGYNLRNPAPLASDNTRIGLNVFEACRESEVGKLVAACSVCAYPKHTPIPFVEDEIWNGYPEESNAPYGVAKRLLIVLSEVYRDQHGLNSCVPVLANLYGPDDNFDLEDSHVIAAMVHKYVAAVEHGEPKVVLWGSGEPSREFLYVDDAARSLVLAAERCDVSAPFNVGTGIETRIRDLGERIARLACYEGETIWDASRPDGQAKRYLDVTKAREWIGFEAEMPLDEGLRRTIESFRSTHLLLPVNGPHSGAG